MFWKKHKKAGMNGKESGSGSSHSSNTNHSPANGQTSGADILKVYNVIIMDRSGSMWSIKEPAIMGYNEVLGGVKAAATKYSGTQEQFFSLVLFDSGSIDTVYWNVPAAKANILTSDTYVPGAATPLYDAMGRTLTKLENELRRDTNHSVVVTIITDGYENSSHEYDLGAIKKLIEHLKQQGWSFAYMGTDHDVTTVSMNLSITNVVQFDKNETATRESFDREKRARERYFDKMQKFRSTSPQATREDQIRFEQTIASEYYKED